MKTITEELQVIAKKHKGILKAEDVVQFAMDPETALHSQFDWEDSEAAHKWRLHQARNIIRINVSTLPHVERSFRTFVSLMDDRQQEGGGYRPTVNVLSNAEHRAALVQQAFDELERWQEKYKTLVEFSAIFEAINASKPTRKRKAI